VSLSEPLQVSRVYSFYASSGQFASPFSLFSPLRISSHVLSEDVLERKVDSAGRLITKRLFSKTSVVPKWAEKFGLLPKSRMCFIVEESIVDPMNRLLTTYTRNIGMRNVLNVHERCELSALAEDNRMVTMMRRWARFESSMRGFSGTVCTFANERFKYNIHKATNGFQLVLEAMYAPHVVLKERRLDQVALLQLHPMLRHRLLEKARNLKEVAKEAALPLIAMAASTEPNTGNVN
jgi:hypothetical protein